ncbi:MULTISPECIES: hypothetical protein [Acinetobacter]|uniref:Uncharacterized protein n=1 Tax=Acinetobacter corruptisaponis TaxID=3045147 RepID=A0ABY8S7E3_9GAMM|nr:hypothetical protein [Acinetobacter sp. KCTC 92772]WHP07603.1 hypothetical protein QLH32_02390 [Acinetobacter sp. KCTC 92772]
MVRILLFLISLGVISSVYSADDFFEKKPSILIAKEEEIHNKSNSSENVDFFELSKQQKIKWANQKYNQATRSSEDLFQTSGMSAYDKAQYSGQNRSLDNKSYSKLIESTPNKRVISEEEYQQHMEQNRKREIDDRDLLYLLDK